MDNEEFIELGYNETEAQQLAGMAIEASDAPVATDTSIEETTNKIIDAFLATEE